MKQWISEHKAWVVGGVVFVVVLVVLFLLGRGKGSGSAPAPTALSFPTPGLGGGGGSGGAPPPPSSGPTTSGPIALPFSPDFGVLSGITDDALRLLYEQEYNLEEQINQATLEGNSSLVTTLQGALSAVQAKIQGYVPSAPAPAPASPPPASTPPASSPTTTFTSDIFNQINQAWSAVLAKQPSSYTSDYQNQLNFWIAELQPYGWNSTEVSQAFAAAKNYVSSTGGLLPGYDQWNYYLQQAAQAANTSVALPTRHISP